MSDRRLSVGFMTTSVGISTGSVLSILTENFLMKRCLHNGCRKCYPTFSRQIKLKNQQACSCLFNENPDNFVSQF